MLFQLRRDVALGVLDGLLADVIIGNARASGLRLGVGDLDVVAENLVESDFEARDARAPDLLGLKLGDP